MLDVGGGIVVCVRLQLTLTTADLLSVGPGTPLQLAVRFRELAIFYRLGQRFPPAFTLAKKNTRKAVLPRNIPYNFSAASEFNSM